eukprot:COSAG01_NODE_3391_length_6151_cov_4.717944_4_plen_72_part_00
MQVVWWLPALAVFSAMVGIATDVLRTLLLVKIKEAELLERDGVYSADRDAAHAEKVQASYVVFHDKNEGSD